MSEQQQPVRRLRIQHVLVKPVLVWDDGNEMVPADEMAVLTLTPSQAIDAIQSLPAQIAALEGQIVMAAQQEADARAAALAQAQAEAEAQAEPVQPGMEVAPLEPLEPVDPPEPEVPVEPEPPAEPPSDHTPPAESTGEEESA